MKINPIMNPNIQKYYQPVNMAPAKVDVPISRDEVTLSEEALSCSKVRTEVEYRTPEERAYIAELTNAVRRGEYRIDSDKIADKILESVWRK